MLSSVLLSRQEYLPYSTRAEVEVRDEALEDMRRRLEHANNTIRNMTERAAVLESAAAERLATVEQSHRAAAALRAEINAFRNTSFLRYLLYCWKTR